MFPPATEANDDGLLCYGGNLQPDTLLAAYGQAIFPFYTQGQPILWWSPDPRMVLLLGDFYCSRRLARRLRQPCFHCTHNADFSAVIHACAAPRNNDHSTPWLLPEMIEAYEHLHRLGHAHSFEVWREDVLIGGLYGVLRSKVFFAESMFSRERDGSKMAMHGMVEHAKTLQWQCIDCQFYTAHLARMGAKEIPRAQLLKYLSMGEIGSTHTD